MARSPREGDQRTPSIEELLGLRPPPPALDAMTPAQLVALAYPKERRSKYGAVRTEVDGRSFASKREAARYMELRLLERAGHITGLRCQQRYPLEINGVRVGTYTADFCYRETGADMVEDVKSPASRTEAYILKRNLMLALYGITILETA